MSEKLPNVVEVDSVSDDRRINANRGELYAGKYGLVSLQIRRKQNNSCLCKSLKLLSIDATVELSLHFG